MAKTKTAADPRQRKKKLLITAIKRTVSTNTVLPILECVHLTGDKAVVTDLETFVKIPFDAPGCNTCVQASRLIDILEMTDDVSIEQGKNFEAVFTDGKRKVKVGGENPDNFPKCPGDRPADLAKFKPAGILSTEDLGRLAIAICFVSNDDLRPAMTGVFLSKEMVATDANRLYRHKLGFKKSFILPPKAAKIILSLGGIGWDVTFDGDHAIFKNDDGIEIVTRTIDAKFPEYNVVIPRQKDMVAKMFSHSALLLAEIKNAMKFANKSTNQIKFTLNGTVSVHAADVDFQYEYENELGFAEFGFKDPAGAQSLSIAFNGKFLTEIIGKLPKDEAVEFWLWGPTKAVVINKDFLLMPLMLNE